MVTSGIRERRRCSNEKMKVSGHRNIGRPKLKWCDVIRKDTKEKRSRAYREKKHKTGELNAPIPNREKPEEEWVLLSIIKTA